MTIKKNTRKHAFWIKKIRQNIAQVHYQTKGLSHIRNNLICELKNKSEKDILR